MLYFHSRDKKPFALKVTFNQGAPTQTYPQAVTRGKTLLWSHVTFPAAGEPEVVREHGSDHGLASFTKTAAVLNRVDADEVESGGVRAKFLYYEGKMPFRNPIKSVYDVGTKTVTVVNVGNYSVFDLVVLVEDAEGTVATSPFSVTLLFAFVPQLKPGRSMRVKPQAMKQKVDFTKSLHKLGFTGQESAAFDTLWTHVILNSGKLFYRLSQSECERLTNLDFNPRPQKIRRAIYALIQN